MSALNGLQSNFQVLSEMRKQSKRRSKDIFQKTPEFLSRIGLEVIKIMMYKCLINFDYFLEIAFAVMLPNKASSLLLPP